MAPALLTPSVFAKAGSQEHSGARARRGSLSTGDAALLRFAAAAEILESDFWIQYNELGGVQDSEVPCVESPENRIVTIWNLSEWDTEPAVRCIPQPQ